MHQNGSKKFLLMNKEKRLLLTNKNIEKIVYYPKEEDCSWNVFQYGLIILRNLDFYNSQA